MRHWYSKVRKILCGQKPRGQGFWKANSRKLLLRSCSAHACWSDVIGYLRDRLRCLVKLLVHLTCISDCLVDHLHILLEDPCLRSWLHKRLSRRGPIFYGQARQKIHRFDVWFLHHSDHSYDFWNSEWCSLIFFVIDSLPMEAKWKAGGAILWRLADANQLSKGDDPHDISHMFFLELHFPYFPVSNKNI